MFYHAYRYRKQREICEKEQRELAEKRRMDSERKARELRKQRILAKQLRLEAKKQTAEADLEYIKNNIDQQTERVVDANGVRWIKCEFCGKIAPEREFMIYGGANHINLGTCKECQKNNPEAQVSKKIIVSTSDKREIRGYNPDECPWCGGQIIEKIGRYGKFRSCSNYPRCEYRPMKH